ncbi:MAG: hypothetical protein K2X00_10975 [Nitrospiraceae bacterium]|nr:hypothetical protein [Nitrospiraceae bacterium]
MPLQDTTLAPPSNTEVLVDRDRRINPRWFSWMKRTFDSLRSTNENVRSIQDATVAQGISITEILELTDGLGARWGVSINGNGQVIGLVRLDGDATGSTFTVVADKFIVAHPTASGVAIQAFVIGLVDGVPTVGINGNVLVDGSILARHISVSSLGAISASFGNASFEDAAYSTTLIGGQPALTIDFSTPRIRMLSA